MKEGHENALLFLCNLTKLFSDLEKVANQIELIVEGLYDKIGQDKQMSKLYWPARYDLSTMKEVYEK